MTETIVQGEVESRLAASEQRLRQLCLQMPVGVWELDLSEARRMVDALRASGVSDCVGYFNEHPQDVIRCLASIRVLSANQGACELAEAKDEAELINSTHRFVPPELALDWTPVFVQFVEGQRVAAIEAWGRTLKGNRRWVSLRATPIAGHEQDWARVLMTTSEMTEPRHREKLEAIGRLAGGVAHDFNNLLSAILSSVEVSIDEAPPDTPMRESLELIREASLRAQDLVQQILTFGRKDKPKLSPLDLSETVNLAVGLARAALSPTELHVSINPDVGTVMADRTQVHRVVLNLCSNAHDAVQATGGEIRISLERVMARGVAQARLRVQDDGAGMNEATRARLFEPYLTTKPNGHGLGLAVVHGIVAALGGTIHVESSPGQGTCFDVFLPLVERKATSLPMLATEGTLQERLLLVDDQPLVRSALCRLLTSLGYQVTEAGDGQEALERWRASPGDFDLVISDQSMPRLSGLELAQMLRKEGSSTPIILCSGFSEVLDEENARALGVSGVLAKPIDRTSMATAVRRALG